MCGRVKTKTIVFSITLAAVSHLSTEAALIAFQSGETLVPGNQLTGAVTYEGWDDLNTGRIDNTATTPGDNATRPYGFHNMTNAWNATLDSNLGTGDSTLWKSGGYGYIASGSLHQGVPNNTINPGGDFEIASLAIDDLETFVFQIDATDRAGDVFDQFPTLTFGATTLSADFSWRFSSVLQAGGMGGPQNRDSYAFQWDLTGQSIAAGTTLTVNWTGLTNSGIYELQINQGSAFTQVVPEPGVLGLAGLAVLGLCRRSRTRR